MNASGCRGLFIASQLLQPLLYHRLPLISPNVSPLSKQVPSFSMGIFFTPKIQRLGLKGLPCFQSLLFSYPLICASRGRFDN